MNRLDGDDHDERCELTETTIEIPPKAQEKEPEVSVAEEVSTAVNKIIEESTETEAADESTAEDVTAEVSHQREVQQQTPPAPSSHADSLAHLLPENSFAQISPRCYIFPGAEVTLENLEGDSEDSDDEFSEEEEDVENELSSSNNAIVVPDIDNVLPEVPMPEVSPTPTLPSSLSPTPSSSSQLQCNDHEIAENLTDIQAVDATEDLEPLPMKRPRLEEKEAETIF